MRGPAFNGALQPTIIKDETQQPTLDAQHFKFNGRAGRGTESRWPSPSRRRAQPECWRQLLLAVGTPAGGGPDSESECASCQWCSPVSESEPPPGWAGRPVVEVEWASPIWSDPESESRYALTTVQSNAHCD